MIRNIYLHGALGDKFEPECCLDVNSVGEALHALCTQLDGFQAYFETNYYEVVRGDQFIDVESQEHQMLMLGQINEIHILPCAAGSKEGGIGKAILGIAAIGLSFYVPGISVAGGLITNSTIASFGFSLLLGGVSSFLSPKPEQPKSAEAVAQNASALFSLPSTPYEGMAIPVIYGRGRYEGIPISQRLRNIDLSAALPKADPAPSVPDGGKVGPTVSGSGSSGAGKNASTVQTGIGGK